MNSSDRPDESITFTLNGHDTVKHLVAQVFQSDEKRNNELRAALSGDFQAVRERIETANVAYLDALASVQKTLAAIDDRLHRVEMAISTLRVNEAAGMHNGHGIELPVSPPKPRSLMSVLTLGLL